MYILNYLDYSVEFLLCTRIGLWASVNDRTFQSRGFPFFQISMNARTPPCLTAQNTVRVLTLRATTRVTVILATQKRKISALVRIVKNSDMLIGPM